MLKHYKLWLSRRRLARLEEERRNLERTLAGLNAVILMLAQAGKGNALFEQERAEVKLDLLYVNASITKEKAHENRIRNP